MVFSMLAKGACAGGSKERAILYVRALGFFGGAMPFCQWSNTVRPVRVWPAFWGRSGPRSDWPLCRAGPARYVWINADGRARCSQRQQTELAAAYAVFIATLFVAPLAWGSRRHRAINLFWASLIFFSLSWSLNVPGIVSLLRLPGLNMMPYNRLAFAAAFAILALTAVGLEVFLAGQLPWRRWFWAPSALLVALCGWCAFRMIVLPEPLNT
jgi:hypothetical protein